jgi:hypothetical protein
MTSFLRTRKDRHPKPENKDRLLRTHTPSDGNHTGRTENTLRGNGNPDEVTQENSETPRGTNHDPSSH